MIDLLFLFASAFATIYTKSLFVGLSLLPTLVYVYIVRSGGKDRPDAFNLLRRKETHLKREQVDGHFDKYINHFGDKSRVLGDADHKKRQIEREKNYQEMVNQYYDIATDFYEYGWGQSFHFAPRFIGEGFLESIRRHEYYLSSRLGLKPGMKCADLGCGVGGPARNIARFSGAKVIGVNNNEYQLKLARKHSQEQGIPVELVDYKKTDFMRLPFDDNQFDAAYQIEATCHAPDLVKCFQEIRRILKPGGVFCGYEWLMAARYDAKNKEHVVIKQGIEQGNGIPGLRTIDEVIGALKKAGFIVEEHFDKCPHPAPRTEVPWWRPLAGDYSLENIRSTTLGRAGTTVLTYVLETLRIAPKGTYKVQCMLTATADDLVSGGAIGIFTPAYFYVAKKPTSK